MSTTSRFEKTLRWYPARWRTRYGDEFTALLDDTFGERELPWRNRAAMARAGLVERAHEAGLMKSPQNQSERLKVGSLLILSGWTFFVIAGAVFAKFTDQWSAATPLAHQTLAHASFVTVQVAGVSSSAIVVLAGTFVVPTFFNLVREEGWRAIRRQVLTSAVAVSFATALTTSAALWAHSLNHHQRNGGPLGFSVLVLLDALSLIGALVVVTTSAVSIATRLKYALKLLRRLALAALALTVLMGLVSAGTTLWWANEAAYAPRFLSNSLGDGVLFTSSNFPPLLVAVGVLMVTGLVVASVGVRRIVEGLRGDESTPLHQVL